MRKNDQKPKFLRLWGRAMGLKSRHPKRSIEGLYWMQRPNFNFVAQFTIFLFFKCFNFFYFSKFLNFLFSSCFFIFFINFFIFKFFQLDIWVNISTLSVRVINFSKFFKIFLFFNFFLFSNFAKWHFNIKCKNHL